MGVASYDCSLRERKEFSSFPFLKQKCLAAKKYEMLFLSKTVFFGGEGKAQLLLSPSVCKEKEGRSPLP